MRGVRPGQSPCQGALDLHAQIRCGAWQLELKRRCTEPPVPAFAPPVSRTLARGHSKPIDRQLAPGPQTELAGSLLYPM